MLSNSNDNLLNEYYEKIDQLINIEKILYKIEKKIMRNEYTIVSSSDFHQKINGFRVFLAENLGKMKDDYIFKALLLTDLDLINKIYEGLKSYQKNDFYDDEKLIDSFANLKSIISSATGIIHDNLELKSTGFLTALKIYNLERKNLYKEIELKKIDTRLNEISFIDGSITKKNEVYNDKIEKLLKIEDGFYKIYKNFINLSEDDFSKKDWKTICDRKDNINYIINAFKNKNIYKFFLLLNENYINNFIDYLDFDLIDGEKVDLVDEKSLNLIQDFHSKVLAPDSFINQKNEQWNTPLFLFNVNYYTILKDYKNKEKLIEESDKKLNLAIQQNGDYGSEIKKYINNFQEKKREFDSLVSNLFISKQIVEVAVKRIKSNETFINEIEGLYINNETRKVYEDLYKDEIKIANRFRNVALLIYALLGVFATISLVILLFSSKQSEWIIRLSDPEKLLIKIPLILTLIFIGVYFSREGDKHRKIANQARQTMKELHAFTSYSTDIQDKVPEIKIKLAEKYFGKTLYGTEKENSSDTDIMKTLVEQTKVTTDLVKTLQGTMNKGSVKPEDN